MKQADILLPALRHPPKTLLQLPLTLALKLS